jgi:hypothetical protein
MKIHVSKLFELTANIAITILAAFILFILAHNFIARASKHVLTPGAQLTLNGVKWDESPNTLLLFLSTNCRFCNESADYYRQLTVAIRNNKKTRLYAIFRQDDQTARAYLEHSNLSIQLLTSEAFARVGITATPTICLVDDKGIIRNIWVGKLSVQKESHILGLLSE